MFNIQRDLEIAGTYNWKILAVNDMGHALIVKIHDGNYDAHYDFDRKTGVFDGHQGRDNNIIRLRAKSEMTTTTEFHLISGKRDWDRGDWVRITDVSFSDGKTAAEASAAHAAKARETGTDWLYAVRKHVQESPLSDYVGWAEERFATGEWAKLPWHDEPWVKPELEHFAHVACSNSFQVAFWDGRVAAQSDAITTLSPGRYLQRFYADVLTPNQIRDWAVKLDVECELTIYTEPDEIVAAYVEAGTGCMRYHDHSTCHDGCEWRSGQNPTRIYGAGDLGVALLRRNGYCIARALVWPAKKAVGRIYGDIERMIEVLQNEGWQFDSTGHSADSRGQGLLNGARLLKIQPEGRDGNFMMPYLDLGYRVDHHDDEHFELTLSGVHYAHRTDGLLFAPDNRDDECDDEDYFYCNSCDDHTHDDDGYWVSGDHVCYSCYENHAFCCELCNEDFWTDSSTLTGSGNRYCRGCADRHLSCCQYCDEYEHNDDIVTIHDANNHCHYQDACTSCAENDHRIVTDVDGERVDISTTQQCETCSQFFGDEAETCPAHEVEPA